MSGEGGGLSVPSPCPRCTGMGDAHYLTCPTLRPRSGPACSCGHRVVDDRACTCTGRCPTCASGDCCAETWAIYERQQAVTVPP